MTLYARSLAQLAQNERLESIAEEQDWDRKHGPASDRDSDWQAARDEERMWRAWP